MNKFQWKLNVDVHHLFSRNDFGNIVCKMAAILSRSRMCSRGHGHVSHCCLFWNLRPRDPHCNQDPLILTQINFNLNKVWDEITYYFKNFNGAIVETWEWISNFIPYFTVIRVISWNNYLSIPKFQRWHRERMNNFIPHFTMDVITFPSWDQINPC